MLAKQMPGPTDEALQIYANLMSELQERCKLIEALANDTVQPKLFLYELGQVQVRKICEVVALCCLCAHESWSEMQTKRMRKEWDPQKIINNLDKINDNFFPFPVKILSQSDGKTVIQKSTYAGRMTKSELIAYWGTSGDNLHRGSLHKLGKKFHPKVDFQGLIAFIHKIGELLFMDHAVNVYSGGQVVVLCTMATGQASNQTFVRVVELDQPS